MCGRRIKKKKNKICIKLNGDKLMESRTDKSFVWNNKSNKKKIVSLVKIIYKTVKWIQVFLYNTFNYLVDVMSLDCLFPPSHFLVFSFSLSLFLNFHFSPPDFDLLVFVYENNVEHFLMHICGSMLWCHDSYGKKKEKATKKNY